MKNKTILAIPVIAILFISILAAKDFAQSPRTVTDFYLLMPNKKYSTNAAGKTIKGKAALNKFRKSLIKVEDIPNGYLQLRKADDSWSEIAIFKKNNGSYIVVESEQQCPNCLIETLFFSYQKGIWKEISKSVMSEKVIEEIANSTIQRNINMEGVDNYIMMPRKGKTLRWVCGECKALDDTPFNYNAGEMFKSEVDGKMKYVLFSWEWNGEKFILNKNK